VHENGWEIVSEVERNEECERVEWSRGPIRERHIDNVTLGGFLKKRK